MPDKKYTYLALGDSYTIGESVSPAESFPHQAVRLLKQKGHVFQPPVIIAKTGWTTDELQNGISKNTLQQQYDFVSLLIGVNNQYRGRSKSEYEQQFEQLLKQALAFAGNNAGHVLVLSIPDWGVTPFAEGRNRNQISSEIDAFNNINKRIALQYGVRYINITPDTREASSDSSLLAEDKLHPSGKEYLRWAQRVAEIINTALKQL